MTADERFAGMLAREAGQLLLAMRDADTGRDPVALRRRGDARSHAFLLHRLAQWRAADAVLSKESIDTGDRLCAKRVWIIDPLDGTREYGITGRDDWAVHIALWERDKELTAAAIAQPARGEVYGTDDVGASLCQRARPRIVVSDTRPPDFAEALAREIGAECVPMASAGAKTMAVIRGDAAAYLDDGGQWEWDGAAPSAVAVAAGLHASRLDGRALAFNARHPYLPDLLICYPELTDRLLAALEKIRNRARGRLRACHPYRVPVCEANTLTHQWHQPRGMPSGGR